MEIASLNLLAGWLGMLGGVVSGAAIGLFYHRDEWMGGYASFRRRMVRLGHISFFGLGFINLMFVFSIRVVEIAPFEARLSSLCFILGLITMPLCCFLTAWRKPFRNLFPIPIISLSTGIIALLAGLPYR
jgi:hypothetical protein